MQNHIIGKKQCKKRNFSVINKKKIVFSLIISYRKLTETRHI